MIIIYKIISFIKIHIVVVITLLVLNIILLVLAIWGNIILQNEVYNKNIEKGISKCSETVNDLDNIIYLGENIVNFVERDYRYMVNIDNKELTTKKLIQETYNLITENTDYFLNLYIACDGKVVSASNSQYEESNPIGRPWYDIALKRGDMVITNPYKDLKTENQVITISHKVDNSNCVVGLDVSQREIQKILNKEVESDNSISFGLVINRDGIIVGHTDDKYLGLSVTDSKIKNAKDIEPYIDEILKDDSGQIAFNLEKYAYSLVYQRTESDWHVLYVVNKKVMNKETNVYRNALIITYIGSFFLLNLVILMYYLKRLNAIRLKERAEKAEIELTNYKNDLEKLVLEKTEDIKIQSNKLRELNTAVIDNLADIVEFRDLESGQHIKRIKKFTYLLANKVATLYPEYSICKEKIDIICNASALHDIGKVGIPDSILLKPSKLTKEEFEEMKNHTVIGDKLVTRILEKYDHDLAKFGHEICRYHHERYDGKGYPDGLKGDEIPICSQIVGVADVYDALIEKRIYKEAFSHEKAIAMIKDGECGVFSEKLLYCLEQVEDEFLRISKIYE